MFFSILVCVQHPVKMSFLKGKVALAQEVSLGCSLRSHLWLVSGADFLMVTRGSESRGRVPGGDRRPTPGPEPRVFRMQTM